MIDELHVSRSPASESPGSLNFFGSIYDEALAFRSIGHHVDSELHPRRKLVLCILRHRICSVCHRKRFADKS